MFYKILSIIFLLSIIIGVIKPNYVFLNSRKKVIILYPILLLVSLYLVDMNPTEEEKAAMIMKSQQAYKNGLAALDKKNFQVAITELEKVTKYDEQNYEPAQKLITDAKKNQSIEIITRAKNTYKKEGYKQELLDTVDEAIKLYNDNYDAHFLKGVLLLQTAIQKSKNYNSNYGNSANTLESLDRFSSFSNMNSALEKKQKENFDAQDALKEIKKIGTQSKESVDKALTIKQNSQEARELMNIIQDFQLTIENTLKYHDTLSSYLYHMSEAISLGKQAEKAQEEGDLEKLGKIKSKVDEEITRMDELEAELSKQSSNINLSQ